MGNKPLEIEIQWRCSHCGHRYEQAVAVCMPTAGAEEPKLLGSGSLVCGHCGQLGPIQIGCAVILGLSVMAGSDGAVQAFHRPGQERDLRQWAKLTRYPSRN